MPGEKSPRITNLWSKVINGENGEWLSKVVIESTKPYPYSAAGNNGTLTVEGHGVVVNMPEGPMEVNDGLLREIQIKQGDEDFTLVEIILENPSDFRVKAHEGFPFRLEVSIDRSYLIRLFSGKTIVVDPGHGGEDIGGRGYVSLMEKDVVLHMAKNLANILSRAGAEVVLTRSGDENISVEERFRIAREAGADAYIGIHTHSSADRSVEGAATLYASPDGEKLARFVQEELVRKIRAKDRGVSGQTDLAALNGVPVVEVEVLAITNMVEEVYLRSLTLYKRAAEGIFNGLIRYFTKDRE